jgi:hypothetical protein
VPRRKKGEETAAGDEGAGSGAEPSAAGLGAPRTAVEGQATRGRRGKETKLIVLNISSGSEKI